MRERGRGFIRAGARRWRRFYDTTGGFQPGVAVPPSLTGDLEMELGRTWIELGLTPADGPEVVLGYDYRFREGAKSMSTWGLSGGIGLAPSFRRINEDVHRITLDVRGEWGRAEFIDEAEFELCARQRTRDARRCVERDGQQLHRRESCRSIRRRKHVPTGTADSRRLVCSGRLSLFEPAR